MSEKIVGYTLLVIGIIVIVLSALNIYAVFTGQMLPVQLFHLNGISLDLSQYTGVKAKPAELIPAETLNQTSNLAAHLFLMGFIASMGQKLASLGVELVRPIVVKLRDEKNLTANSWTTAGINKFSTG